MFQPIIRAQIELTSNLFNSCFVPFDRLSTTLACLLSLQISSDQKGQLDGNMLCTMDHFTIFGLIVNVHAAYLSKI